MGELLRLMDQAKQRMPASQCPHIGEPKKVVSFCDASWGVDSVSGAILIYKGCCINFFPPKQEVPALSSAEAEIIESKKPKRWFHLVVANHDSRNSTGSSRYATSNNWGNGSGHV